MRFISNTILLLLITSAVFAGPKLKNVKGSVVERGQEGLAGVKIEVKGTGIVVYSDFDGEFVIEKLKPGIYDLSISLISYQELEVEKVELTFDNSGDLLFELSSR